MSDKSSFKSMVFAMQSNLMAFAMKLTLNKEEAQDLVQDTNLKALKNEAKFVDASNPRGWMLTIMRNIFINNYRRSTRENIVLDTSDDGYLLNLPQESGMSNPEGAFALGEITSIIEKFPEDYCQPFNSAKSSRITAENNPGRQSLSTDRPRTNKKGSSSPPDELLFFTGASKKTFVCIFVCSVRTFVVSLCICNSINCMEI